MKSFDACIVGNIFLDTVQTTNSFQAGVSNLGLSSRISLGGVMNTARNLCEMDKNYKVFVSTVIGNDNHGTTILNHLEAYKKENENFDYHASLDGSSTTNAFVICETEKQIRSGIVNWGACKESSNFTIPEARWYHFMYLDSLHGIDKKIFTNISNPSIISADFCLASHTDAEKRRIMGMLKHIDFVIASDDSCSSITKEKYEIYSAMTLGQTVKLGAIVHTPKGSFVSSQGNEFMVASEYIKDTNLDVLGAGDAFAAAFIYHTSTSDELQATKETVQHAHTYATNYIQGMR
jgi:sugar/nucleoside kinase (ribokinase family)